MTAILFISLIVLLIIGVPIAFVPLRLFYPGYSGIW